ncbi:MAG: MBL fold metallo-hydrolase [Thermoplasmata archaeon]|nr:MBL fold metallo-hydrolase [Thermoplasmata archaeon]
MDGEPLGLPHPFSRPEREGAVPLIDPPALARLIAGPEPPLLVDVRPAAERSLARLPNDRHLPLPELVRSYATLPHGRPIVVYDQFGSGARRAVEYLQRKGLSFTAALEGGIDEFSRIVDPSIPRYRSGARDGDLVLLQIPRYDSGCLAYLVADPVERKAVVIDPGRAVDPYLEALRAGGWELSAILETHTHADHLAGHAALHERTDAPIEVSHRSPASYPHHRLTEGDHVEFGGEVITVLETPGHTADHLTLRLRDKIFTGDTLLIGACGRTDLGDGNPDQLYESLTGKLLRLPDDTEVLPAHFGKRHALPERYSSNVGFERVTNEALLQGSLEAFRTYMTEGWPPKPAEFDRIVRENLER